MKNKSNTVIFIVLSVFCLILITASTIRGGWLSPLRKAVGVILEPLQEGVNSFGRGIYDSIQEKQTLEEVKAENEELQRTINQLMMENTRLEEQSFELQRLQELYKLDQQYEKYDSVAARIIARDSSGWFNIFRIDKGSNDGIQVDMNVIAGGGLVGIVTDVGTNYATVRSIIDDSSRVSAMSMRTSDTAIVSGNLQSYDEGKLLISEIVSDADIKDGDKIITSNISSKYLPGILIGYASDITTDSNNLTKSGYIIPVAQFTSLREVLVITTLKQ
jgi:rod shape-determining protein MreC